MEVNATTARKLAIHLLTLGPRAKGMILAGFIWFFVGVGILTGATVPTETALFHLWIPGPARVMMWWLPAMYALGVSTSNRYSKWGLAALFVPPFVQGASYFTSWIIEVIPGPPPGEPRGWLSACYYVTMIAFVFLVSDIPANVRTPLTGRKR